MQRLFGPAIWSMVSISCGGLCLRWSTLQGREERPPRYYRQQWIADQGFIVLMVDGRGTPRGRLFERAIAGDLATVPVDDRWRIRGLLEQVDGASPTRISIYGWSFGGYLSAMCLLRAPELFKAAVSGALSPIGVGMTHYRSVIWGFSTKTEPVLTRPVWSVMQGSCSSH